MVYVNSQQPVQSKVWFLYLNERDGIDMNLEVLHDCHASRLNYNRCASHEAQVAKLSQRT